VWHHTVPPDSTRLACFWLVQSVNAHMVSHRW